MFRKILFVCVIAFSVLGCEQPTEIIREVTTINNIPIIWKGSLAVTPQNPSVGWAYYDTGKKAAFIWDGGKWEILAQDGISIIWKGELPAAPSSPQLNWAYYNVIDGNSYIYNGSKWDLLAKAGRDGASGILLWLGTLPAAPANPSAGWAYHNSIEGISYIWGNSKWEVLAKDGSNGTNGVGITWKGASSNSPANPQLNWAYYNTTDNKSYIWNGSTWQILAESGSSTITVSITWKGSLTAAPFNPQIGWMYYNSVLGKTYVWDGSTWNIAAQDGTSPEGFLITWKGGLATAPTNPQKGWAYYNTSQKKSFIWDGSTWQILAQDGADGSGSGGNTGVNGSGKIAIYKNGQEISMYEIPTIDAGTTTSVEFEIRNTGSTVLYLVGDPLMELLYTSVNASTSRGVTIDTSTTTSTIQPGSFTTFKVNYAPQGGDSRGYISILIRSSDASRAPFYFYVYRSAKAPGMGITIYANSTSYSAIPYYYYVYYLTDPLTYSAYSSYMFNNVNFGNVVVGNSASTSSFTINNNYGGITTTLNLTGNPPIQISGPDANCFSVVQPSVTSFAPQATNNTAKITFTPLSVGEKTATITIPNNTIEVPNFSFAITGAGISQPPVPVPSLNFTMTVNETTYTEYPYGDTHFSSANFGTVPTNGATSAAITIRNSGGNNTGTVLNLTGNPPIQISGSNADCFTVTQPSSKNISAGYSTTASIKFTPTSTGAKTATVTIPNNSPDASSFSFTVTGTGTAAVPMMYISMSVKGTTYTEYPYQYAQTPASNYTFNTINFGDAAVLYGDSIIASVNIQNNAENNSGAVFNLTGTPPIQISGTGASSFSVIQPQVTSLAGGSNTTARIQFTPTSSGQKNATITIPNNSPEKPNFSFTVTGNGITYPVLPWPKVFDGNNGADRIYCSLTDSQGNLYFIGQGYNLVSSSSYYDWWIKKFNSNGNEIMSGWDKKISINTSTSSSSSNDRPEYAVLDGSDNIIVSDGNCTIKFSPAGAELWRLSTGGTLYTDSANSVFVVKSSSITKYNSAGTQQWTKSYGGTLKINSANNILVYSGNSLQYLTQTGTESWTKTVTGFTINDAVMDSSGNIYIVGYGSNLVNGASGRDVWIKKYNSAGTETTTGWDKKIDWGYNTDEYAQQIFIYGSYVFVTGYGYNIYTASSGADGWIKQYTTSGQERSTWNKVLDDNSSVNLLRIDSSGNLYFYSRVGTDSVISKYSINNVLINTIQYNRSFSYTNPQTGRLSSSTYVDYPVLMFDASENLYVSGTTYYSNISSAGSGYDWVIRKFNSAGVEQ